VDTFDAPTDAGARGERVDGVVRGLRAAEPSPAPPLTEQVMSGGPSADVQDRSAGETAAESSALPKVESSLFAMPKRRARGVLSAAKGAERVGSEGAAPEVGLDAGRGGVSVETGEPASGAPFSEEEPPTQVHDVPSAPGANDDRVEVAQGVPSEAAQAPVEREATGAESEVPVYTEDEPPTQVGEAPAALSGEAPNPPAASAASEPTAPGGEPHLESAASLVEEGASPDGAVAFEDEPPTRPGVAWTADEEALAEAPPPPRVRAAPVVPVEDAEDGSARAVARPAPARPTKAGRTSGPRPVIAIPVSEPEPFTQAEAPTQPDGAPIDLPVEPLDALPKVPGVWAGPAWDESSEEVEDDRPVVSEQLADVSPAVAARARLSAAVSEGPGSTVWEVDPSDRGRGAPRDGRSGPRPEPIGVVFPTDPPSVDPRQVALWLGGAALVTMVGWVLFG
jgi:hypothetical protein